MTRVGITGHRDLHDPTDALVSAAITKQLGEFGSVHGISSLAEGADQIFAEQVLKGGGALTAVIPSAHYGRSFATTAGKAAYRRLRALATEVIELPFPLSVGRGLLGCGAAGRRPRRRALGRVGRTPSARRRRHGAMSSPSPESVACRQPCCGRRVRAGVERDAALAGERAVKVRAPGSCFPRVR